MKKFNLLIFVLGMLFITLDLSAQIIYTNTLGFAQRASDLDLVKNKSSFDLQEDILVWYDADANSTTYYFVEDIVIDGYMAIVFCNTLGKTAVIQMSFSRNIVLFKDLVFFNKDSSL